MTREQKADILAILDGAHDTTVATVREDGYPQATTVSFVHDGLTIYFGCDLDSQKAQNIRRCDKVSLTVNLPYESWADIRGLSLGGGARIVTDTVEIQNVVRSMIARFPQSNEFASAVEGQQLGLVRVEPEVISLLDYRKALGHTDVLKVGHRR